MKLFLALLLLSSPLLPAQNNWQDKLLRGLPLMGEHNWIVVADAAYPLQNATGIDVLATGLSETDLLTAVLTIMGQAPHVRPVFMTDAELPFVSETDANGISAFRVQLAALLKGGVVEALPEAQILTEMDDVSRSYRVLVLKSTTTLPYSSVFIQLQSRYWSPDAEKRLRAAIQAKSQ